MLGIILILLIILWLLGFVHVPGIVIRDTVLFNFNGKPVSLWEILIFAVIVWAVGVLPSPIRQIAAVVLAVWVLAALGVVTVAGLPNVLLGAVIIGLFIAFFSGRL